MDDSNTTHAFTDEWLKGKRIVVMGLGRFGGGVGVTRFLASRGAKVLVTDRADAETLRGSLDKLADVKVDYRLGEHHEDDLNDADLMVASPAVDRHQSEFCQIAGARGIPITTEINLFLARCPAKLIGITGTIGKSTTCAMTHAILSDPSALSEIGANRTWLGGNIGASLLAELDTITAKDVVVLELSSFQLEVLDCPGSTFDVAGLTNARPHHLERHGSFDAYFDAKLNLFRALRKGGSAVVATDDAPVVEGVSTIAREYGSTLVDAHYRNERYELAVPGAHNQANAHMAWKLAEAMGVSDATARKALATFDGLPHRLAFVCEHAGVRYYNDSKSTSADAIATALAAFDAPTVLLCGGKDIGAELDRVVNAPWNNVRAVVCFGDAGPRLAILLRSVSVNGSSLAIHLARGVPEAVGFAEDLARTGDVVLFSPGCPSYDAFVNYEARGDSFCQLVRTMAGVG